MKFDFVFRPVLMLMLLNCLITSIARAQDLEKLTPPTPEVASLLKDFNIPVGYYTGVPDISIPLADLSIKGVSFPVQLSYNASGNRVEEIASYVGLGWNIGGAPFIARSILDKPDGEQPGVKPLQNGKSWATHMATSANRFMLQPIIYEGGLDTEADIYTFSLIGKSGKFWWDYNENRYVVSPHYNIKIDYPDINGPIVITDEDGTVYKFNYVEHTNSVAMSWRVTGVINYEKTDSIVFGYSPNLIQRYIYNNKFKDYQYSCDNSPVSYISLGNNYTIYSIRNSKNIIYFEQDTVRRRDIQGDGGRLKYIHYLNYNYDTIQKYELYHNYFQANDNSNSCVISSHRTELFYRLVLDSIVNITNPSSRQIHQFEYNTSVNIPCAVSTAQDFWGGYNGKTNNISLIANYRNGTFTLGDNADRGVSPIHSQWGLLKKMTYPTGGSVNFEYENNRIKVNESTYVAPQSRFAYIDSYNHISGGTYSDTLCINNPPNRYLNNSNAMGGSFLKFVFDEIGYDWREGMQSSALLYFNGLSPNNMSYSTTISYHLDNYYVPNGCYELKAQFAESAPENFFFMTFYGYLDTIVEQQSGYTGGHRIAKITHHEGTSIAKETTYDYVDPSTGQSSGDVFSHGYLPKLSTFRCFGESVESPATGYALLTMYRLYADPLTTDANHTGSYVGYQMVTEINKDAYKTGKSVYKYLHSHDMVDMDYPYFPTLSFSEYRGHLKETIHYSYNNDTFYPVQKTINDYIFSDLTGSNPASYLAFDQYYFNRDPNPYSMFYFQHPGGEIYYHFVIKSALASTTEVNYVNGDTTRFSSKYKQYNYDPASFLLTSTYEITSESDTLFDIFTRPVISYSPSLNNVIDSVTNQKLIDRNNLLAILSTNTYKNSKLLNQIVNNYGSVDSLSAPVINLVKQAYFENPLRNRAYIDLYDRYGNILEQHLDGNLYYSYVYGYNNKNIVAEVENARKNQIAYTSFEDNHFSGWQLNQPANIYPSNTAFSGNNVYSGQVFKSLPQGDYIIEFAAKGTVMINNNYVTANYVKEVHNEYKVYSLIYDDINSIRVSADSLDEVRLYPKTGSMKSYTWNKAGLLEMIMSDNLSSQRFSYDGLMRLSEVKDIDGNTLKKYCYNLYNQEEICSDNQLYYFSTAVSGTFTRNNCGGGGIPNTINYTVPAGYFTSTISQADANIKAEQHLINAGQIYANLNAGCSWTNDSFTLNFTRDCPVGFTGSTLPFTVPANQFTSNFSKNNANQQALNWLSINGRINANTNGTCVSNCTSTCLGVGKKCVNNICETGIILLIDCVYQAPDQYQAWYAYVYSDNSMSAPWYEMTSTNCIEEN